MQPLSPVSLSHHPQTLSSSPLLTLTTIHLAHKFINDSSMANKHWAEVSDIFDNNDILAMEAQFLKIIRYTLVVSEAEVFEYGRQLLGPAFLHSPFWDL